MQPKTHLTEPNIKAILAFHGLGTYSSHIPLTAGTVQINHRVTTNRGDFVLRLYENRTFNSVLFECAVIEHLTAHHYPCPCVYRSQSGEVAGTFNGKPYAIFEFIEGEHFEQATERQNQQLIEHMGILHQLTEGFQPPHMADRWNYNPEMLIQLAQAETRKIGDENAQRKLKWYTSEITKLELPDDLPRGVVHSDFHFSNVLFQEGNFKALIDFDDANYTALLFDVAAIAEPFKASFDHDSWSDFPIGADVFDFSEVRKTIETYNRFRSINAIEKRHFFDVCKLLVFVDCLWFYARGGAQDFYERRKISYLNRLGREEFINQVFAERIPKR